MLSAFFRIVARAIGNTFIEYFLGESRNRSPCMPDGIIYPDYTDSLGSVGAIRELLSDLAKDPVAKVDGEWNGWSWCELVLFLRILGRGRISGVAC